MRLVDFLPADRRTPSQSVDAHDAFSRVCNALTELPELQREAILLKHFEGFTLEEAGEKLGKTPVAVASLLRRGLSTMRQRMLNTAD